MNEMLNWSKSELFNTATSVFAYLVAYSIIRL